LRRRRRPSSAAARVAHRLPQLRKVAVDDAPHVAVQLRAQRPIVERSDAGEPGAEDLVDVIGKRDAGLAVERWTAAIEQLPEADGGGARHPLRERKRAHAQADDAPAAGVGARPPRRRRAGEQEAARSCARVHGATDLVPYRRHVLPLVDQHGRRRGEHAIQVGLRDCARPLIVELVQAAGAL
jgi:hypothetical protein